MNIELLDGKAIVVQHGDNVWLLGCPAGVGAALKEAGVMPTAVLLTRVGAPGLTELEGNPMVVRSMPFRIGGLEALPTSRTHGWDYVIKSEDGSLLWTERGDVSARDVMGYSLAIIGNKHRSESFGNNVITRPWPTGTWCIQEKTIKHEGDKWVIYSADGTKKLGEYDTEEEAKERLRQIEYFKHQKKQDGEPPEDELPKPEPEAPVADEPEPKPEALDSKPTPELAGEKEGSIENLTKHLAKKYGGDPGFFSSCMDASELADYEEDRRAAICARAHKIATGKWPGEKPGAEKKTEKNMPAWVPAELSTPGVAFKEQADGRWRWYAHTTNDMLDLQKEVIPPEAIDWSLAVATVLNDRGPLLFRHMPIRLGACDKQVRVGPMLFESGLLDAFEQNAAAKAAVALVTRQPGIWKMSPGLRFKEEDLINGRYRRCWIAERSLTPSPANLTTAFAVVKDKEMQVTDEMLKEAADQLGLPFEQIKALAQKYLDTQKEFADVDGLLKALKEGVVNEYAPTAPPPAAPESDVLKIVQANTAAMNALAAALKELAAGKFVDAQVQTAIEDYLQQAPQFGSQSKGVGDGDEAAVRAALAEAEKATAQRATQHTPFSMTEFEKQFTSTNLNPA